MAGLVYKELMSAVSYVRQNFPVETALSNVLGQDGNRILNTPLCELDPDVAVDALEACMSTLIKEVEPHCADSLNLHALAGKLNGKQKKYIETTMLRTFFFSIYG